MERLRRAIINQEGYKGYQSGVELLSEKPRSIDSLAQSMAERLKNIRDCHYNSRHMLGEVGCTYALALDYYAFNCATYQAIDEAEHNSQFIQSFQKLSEKADFDFISPVTNRELMAYFAVSAVALPLAVIAFGLHSDAYELAQRFTDSWEPSAALTTPLVFAGTIGWFVTGITICIGLGSLLFRLPKRAIEEYKSRKYVNGVNKLLDGEPND